jgi:peptide/nickel transport system substrate-binding protein
MGIIPRHIYEGKDLIADTANRQPVGTGPYRLKEWVSGQRIVLEAFDDYFEGRPKLDRIVARIIPDQATLFLELKFGGIDSMSPTPAQYKHQIQTEFFKQYFQSFRYPSFGYTYLGYNLKHPLFADKRVRQAIAYAINKKEIIAGVLLGYGSEATGPFIPSSWAYNPAANAFTHDPVKAKRMLAELGWKTNAQGMLEKDGIPFSFTVITNSANATRLQAAQIIKQQLKQVGIDMKIMVLEWQTMLHKFIDKRQFEAVLMGWSVGMDPDSYIIWHSSQTKEGEFNFISYQNEEVDRLLVAGRETFDPVKRKTIYQRIHALIADDQPYTFLFIPDALPVLHRRLKGVEPAPIGLGHNFIDWYVPQDKALWYK